MALDNSINASLVETFYKIFNMLLNAKRETSRRNFEKKLLNTSLQTYLEFKHELESFANFHPDGTVTLKENAHLKSVSRGGSKFDLLHIFDKKSGKEKEFPLMAHSLSKDIYKEINGKEVRVRMTQAEIKQFSEMMANAGIKNILHNVDGKPFMITRSDEETLVAMQQIEKAFFDKMGYYELSVSDFCKEVEKGSSIASLYNNTAKVMRAQGFSKDMIEDFVEFARKNNITYAIDRAENPLTYGTAEGIYDILYKAPPYVKTNREIEQKIEDIRELHGTGVTGLYNTEKNKDALANEKLYESIIEEVGGTSDHDGVRYIIDEDNPTNFIEFSRAGVSIHNPELYDKNAKFISSSELKNGAGEQINFAIESMGHGVEIPANKVGEFCASRGDEYTFATQLKETTTNEKVANMCTGIVNNNIASRDVLSKAVLEKIDFVASLDDTNMAFKEIRNMIKAGRINEQNVASVLGEATPNVISANIIPNDKSNIASAFSNCLSIAKMEVITGLINAEQQLHSYIKTNIGKNPLTDNVKDFPMTEEFMNSAIQNVLESENMQDMNADLLKSALESKSYEMISLQKDIRVRVDKNSQHIDNHPVASKYQIQEQSLRALKEGRNIQGDVLDGDIVINNDAKDIGKNSALIQFGAKDTQKIEEYGKMAEEVFNETPTDNNDR